VLIHHFIAAKRHMVRRPAYLTINLLGLAIGLAACLLIALYIQHELSYDRFHPNAERIYRVLREFDMPSLRSTIDATPMALASAVAGVSGIERAVRIFEGSPRVSRDGRAFVEPAFVLADDGFFDVFSFPLLRGAARLDRPGTLLITASTATRYFPSGVDPVGALLDVEGIDMEVTGVLADPPTNSHLRFDFVASMLDAEDRQDERAWSVNDFATYLLLERGADLQRVAAEVARVVDARNTAPSTEGNNFVPHLQSLADIRFGGGVPVEINPVMTPVADPLYVYLFGALAVSILLVACANFTNLATARASERAREIGVRKTLGATRRQLTIQFLGESLLTTAVSLTIALALARLALPYFNTLAEKSLTLAPLYSGANALALLGLLALVGAAAGLYPALVLSRFETTGVLKGGPVRAGIGGRRFRRALVVFQFGVSIAMIASTAVVLDQFDYLRGTGLGFEPDDVLVVRQVGDLDDGSDYAEDRIAVFEQEVARLPGVQSVSAAFSVPGTLFMNSLWRPDEPDAASQNVNYSFIDTDYVETLGLEIIAGRAPSADLAADATAVLLNEAAARRFGWSANEAVGKRLVPPWGDDRHTVVGVTRDFNYYSLHEAVYPVVLAVRAGVPSYAGGEPRYIALRVAQGEAAAVIDGVLAVWRQFSDLPLQISMLADDLATQYRAEQRLAGIFAAFAALAVLIACLGLLGLAAFATDQRRKEIGVRKVLGANKTRILALMSAEYLLLVGVAFVIAAPVAYALLHEWLERFAYRIDLGWAPFLLAGGLAAACALLAVGAEVLKAAGFHPARALRHE